MDLHRVLKRLRRMLVSGEEGEYVLVATRLGLLDVFEVKLLTA